MTVPEKIILGIVLSFLFLFIVVLGGYWLVFRGLSTGFLSLNPKLTWEIDKESVKKLDEVKRESGGNGPLLIILSPNFEFIPDNATGFSEGNKILYTARFSELGPVSVLNVFVNTPEWEKADPALRGNIISNFISLQMDLKYKLSDEAEKSLYRARFDISKRFGK